MIHLTNKIKNLGGKDQYCSPKTNSLTLNAESLICASVNSTDWITNVREKDLSGYGFEDE